MIRLSDYIVGIFICIIAYCGNAFTQHLFSTNSSFGLFKGNVRYEFDYIRDGLVHWYDSEINSTNKQSHKSGIVPIWTDLIGNNNLNLTDDSSLYFGDENGLVMPIDRTSGIYVADIPNDDCITIEICYAYQREQNFRNKGDYNLHTLIAQGSDDGTVYNFSAPFFITYIYDYNVSHLGWSGSADRFIWGIIARGKDYAWRGFTVEDNSYTLRNTTTTISITNNNKLENDDNNDSMISYPYAYGWLKRYYVFDYNHPALIWSGIIKTRTKSDGLEGAMDLPHEDDTVNRIKIKENEFQVGGTRYFDFETNKYIEQNHSYGYIFCIRIYNRVLTDAEREHNADIDLARFYKSWPDKNK